MYTGLKLFLSGRKGGPIHRGILGLKCYPKWKGGPIHRGILGLKCYPKWKGGPTQSAWSRVSCNLAKSSVKAKVYTVEVLIGLLAELGRRVMAYPKTKCE
jgi:hypothetical protein